MFFFILLNNHFHLLAFDWKIVSQFILYNSGKTKLLLKWKLEFFIRDNQDFESNRNTFVNHYLTFLLLMFLNSLEKTEQVKKSVNGNSESILISQLKYLRNDIINNCQFSQIYHSVLIWNSKWKYKSSFHILQ